MRRALIFLIALIAANIAVSGAIAAEMKLRVHHFLGADSLPHKQIIMPWAKRIESQSGGRIKVEIYPGLALGGRSPELIEQVRSGVVDIIWTAAAYTPGLFPSLEVFSLPMVHRGNAVATNLAIMQIYKTDLAAEFSGLHPLLIHVHQGHVLHMMDSSISDLAGIAGKIIRPPGRRIGRWSVEALGAQITKKRHPKIAKALKHGKLDGVLMSFHLASNMGVLDVAQSHIMPEENNFFGTSIYLFLMNKSRYEALAPELRDIIDRNSGRDFAIEAGKIYEAAGTRAMQRAKALGHKIISLDGQADKPMQKILQIWADDMKGKNIDGMKLIEKARTAIALERETAGLCAYCDKSTGSICPRM